MEASNKEGYTYSDHLKMTTCVLANHLTGNVLAAKIVSRIRKLQVKSAWKTLEKHYTIH